MGRSKGRSRSIKRAATVTFEPRRKRSTVPRGVTSAFPKKRLVRHRYVENVQLPAAGGAGQLRQYVFACNNMFDPNVTGTGHQPLYRDEMAAMYKYYTVIASYIRVTYTQSESGLQNYGIVMTQDTSLNIDPTTTLEEYPYKPPTSLSLTNRAPTRRSSFDAKKALKTSLAGILGDDTQRLAPGSSPSAKNAYYYVIWTAPVLATTTLSAATIQVEVSYITMWQDPVDAVQS